MRLLSSIFPETGKGFGIGPGWPHAFQRAGAWSLALAVLVFTSFSHAGDPPPLEKLSFLPQWRPQAQFAGYYVALEKGLYRRAGIELEIIPGGPDRSATDYLIHHKADVVSMWLSSAVQLAADGVDIGHLAQVIQRSALMMVSRKSSAIKSIRDMNGKKIAMWPSDFQIQPLAFFERNGIVIQPITMANTLNLFLQGGTDLALVMWYNEYHTLQMYGIDPEQLQPFFFSETDLDFPEDGLFAMGDTWVSRQNTLCRFVRTSFDGWRYAFEHPEEAIDIVLAAMLRESVPASRNHQTWMLSCMKSLILPKNPPGRMGVLQASDYTRVSRVLEDCHRIVGTPNFDYFSKGCMNDVSQ